MSMRGIAQLLAVLGVAIGWAGASPAASIIGGGLDAGGACPQSGGVCGTPYDFAVVPAAATGDISFTFNGAPSWTVDVHVEVPSLTMDATGGAIDGVDEIVFTNLQIDVTGWNAVESAGQILGATTTGTVSGTYEQFSSNASVAGPANFGPVDVSFTSLNCLASLDSQCGFSVGNSTLELILPVGTTDGGSPYEFVWTFNVLVPEPATASLLGVGLLGVAAVRRRRA